MWPGCLCAERYDARHASARAKADDLEDKRNQLDSQIEAQKSVVEGASKDLTDAIAALDSSKTELAEAEASLAQAESRLSEAKELDSQRAAELKAAETKAEKAQADVAAAQAAYDSVDARTSERSRSSPAEWRPGRAVGSFQ